MWSRRVLPLIPNLLILIALAAFDLITPKYAVLWLVLIILIMLLIMLPVLVRGTGPNMGALLSLAALLIGVVPFAMGAFVSGMLYSKQENDVVVTDKTYHVSILLTLDKGFLVRQHPNRIIWFPRPEVKQVVAASVDVPLPLFHVVTKWR
jgi:hypothetical protein